MKGWSTRRQLRSGNRGSRARGRGAHAHGSTATLWLRKAEPDRTVSRRLSIRSALSASSVPRAPATPSSVGTIDHLPMMVSLRSPRCRGRRWSASSGGLRVPFSGSSRQRLSARGASSRTRFLVSDSNPESRQAVSLGSIFLVFLVNTQRNQSAKNRGEICDCDCALGEFFGERDVDRRTSACSSCCCSPAVSRRAASSSTHRRS